MRKRLSFGEFVERATACVGDRECMQWNLEKRGENGLPAEGLHSRTNPHWRPQILLANLDQYLHLHNFVGNMTYLGNHTYQLLSRLGLWERYGADGWGRQKRGEIFDRNNAAHRTGTRGKLGRFYTPALVQKVRGAYSMDYKLFDVLGISKTDTPGRGHAWEGMRLKDIDPRLEGTFDPPKRKQRRKGGSNIGPVLGGTPESKEAPLERQRNKSGPDPAVVSTKVSWVDM